MGVEVKNDFTFKPSNAPYSTTCFLYNEFEHLSRFFTFLLPVIRKVNTKKTTVKINQMEPKTMAINVGFSIPNIRGEAIERTEVRTTYRFPFPIWISSSNISKMPSV
jgi:hypothetical protein